MCERLTGQFTHDPSQATQGFRLFKFHHQTGVRCCSVLLLHG